MADEEPAEGEEAPKPKRKSKLPMILGLVLLLAGGGGGFFAVQKGLLFGGGDSAGGAGQGELAGTGEGGGEGGQAMAAVEPIGDIAYVPIPPLVINLGVGSGARHLRFTAQVEANAPYAADVERLIPRIVDVLNGYLRAVDLRDIEDRSALVRLRAQMLRRIQLVTGAGRVRDLLVMEFVVN
jgi:flagellar protein FliL